MNEDANNSSRQVRGNQRVKIAMKVSPILAVFLTLISLCLPGCGKKEEETHEEQHTIVVTSPLAKDVSSPSRMSARSTRNAHRCPGLGERVS